MLRKGCRADEVSHFYAVDVYAFRFGGSHIQKRNLRFVQFRFAEAERFDELVRNRRTRNIGKGIARIFYFRIENRTGIGKRFGRIVVIGDDNVDTELSCVRDFGRV